MFAPKHFRVAAFVAAVALVVGPALTVRAATKPSAPTGLNAAVTSSSATISWNRVSGADSYQICLLTNGSTTQCYRKSHKDDRTSVTFYTLKPTGGTDYFYKVYAYNGSANSVSVKKSFDLAPAGSPSGPTTTLAAPTGLRATPSTTSSTISWSPVSGADSYVVCLARSQSGSCERKSYKNDRLAVTFYKLTPQVGTDYFYKVFAYRGTTQSVSTVASFNLAAPAQLTAPTGIAINTTYASAAVSWKPVTAADSYQVCLVTNGTTTQCYRKSTKDARTAVTFYKLAPTSGADYYAIVTAFDGSASKTAGRVRFDLPTSPIATLSVKDFDYKWFELAWTPSTNADGYDMQVATDKAMTQNLTTFSTSGRSQKTGTLTAGRTYYYRVRPKNGSIAGAFTAVGSRVSETKPFTTRLITYNLCGQDKCVTSSNGMKRWSTRKPLAGAIARSTASDIVATQESHFEDTNFGTQLTGFSLAAYYSSKSLFYRTEKFQKMRSGTITLSSSRRRYAVWAEFKDRVSHTRFIVADAHLEPYKGETNDDLRKAQTQVLIAGIKKINGEDLTVVYAGDYNSNKDNADPRHDGDGYDAVQQVFEAAGIPDSYETSPLKANPDYNSANQAKNPANRYYDHVDHVYLDPRIKATYWKVITTLSSENYYSTPFATDHNPIYTSLTVPGRG